MWTRTGQERVEHLSLHKYSPSYYVVINIFRSTGQITTARDRFRNPTTLAACQMSCPHAGVGTCYHAQVMICISRYSCGSRNRAGQNFYSRRRPLNGRK